MLAWHKLASGATATFTGFLLVIAAAFSWAVGNVLAKRAAGRADVDMLGLVVWSSLVAPLPLAVASFAFEGGAAVWDAVRRHDVAAVGVRAVHELFRHAVRARALERAAASLPDGGDRAVRAPDPHAGLASGALFLGERLAAAQFAGVALVLAGLAYNVFGARARMWLARSLD